MLVIFNEDILKASADIINVTPRGNATHFIMLHKCLLKKVTLDKDALCNYRPVSNLPQLSKVIEKVILQRLTRHIEDESMFDSYQSAYRANHSTETALLFVVNQI